jgi:hypothetical protein
VTDEVDTTDIKLALENSLREFAAFYDSSATDDDRRYAGCQQLMAIASYIQRQGVPSEVLRPTTVIIHALFDLDKGNHPTLLRPAKKAGGQTIPFDQLCQRGLAAGVVTMLMQADHLSEQEALQKVAFRIAKWPAAKQRPTHGKKNTPLWQALQDWRGRAMTGSPEDDPDASAYGRVLKMAESGIPPGRVADWILEHGIKIYR